MGWIFLKTSAVRFMPSEVVAEGAFRNSGPNFRSIVVRQINLRVRGKLTDVGPITWLSENLPEKDKYFQLSWKLSAPEKPPRNFRETSTTRVIWVFISKEKPRVYLGEAQIKGAYVGPKGQHTWNNIRANNACVLFGRRPNKECCVGRRPTQAENLQTYAHWPSGPMYAHVRLRRTCYMHTLVNWPSAS